MQTCDEDFPCLGGSSSSHDARGASTDALPGRRRRGVHDRASEELTHHNCHTDRHMREKEALPVMAWYHGVFVHVGVVPHANDVGVWLARRLIAPLIHARPNASRGDRLSVSRLHVMCSRLFRGHDPTERTHVRTGHGRCRSRRSNGSSVARQQCASCNACIGGSLARERTWTEEVLGAAELWQVGPELRLAQTTGEWRICRCLESRRWCGSTPAGSVRIESGYVRIERPSCGQRMPHRD